MSRGDRFTCHASAPELDIASNFKNYLIRSVEKLTLQWDLGARNDPVVIVGYGKCPLGQRTQLLMWLSVHSEKCRNTCGDVPAGKAQKNKTVAVDDQNWSKIDRSKNTQYRPPRNERGWLTGTKKMLP